MTAVFLKPRLSSVDWNFDKAGQPKKKSREIHNFSLLNMRVFIEAYRSVIITTDGPREVSYSRSALLLPWQQLLYIRVRHSAVYVMNMNAKQYPGANMSQDGKRRHTRLELWPTSTRGKSFCCFCKRTKRRMTRTWKQSTEFLITVLLSGDDNIMACYIGCLLWLIISTLQCWFLCSFQHVSIIVYVWRWSFQDAADTGFNK